MIYMHAYSFTDLKLSTPHPVTKSPLILFRQTDKVTKDCFLNYLKNHFLSFQDGQHYWVCWTGSQRESSERWRLDWPTEPFLHHRYPNYLHRGGQRSPVRGGPHPMLVPRRVSRDPCGLHEQYMLDLKYLLHTVRRGKYTRPNSRNTFHIIVASYSLWIFWYLRFCMMKMSL